MSQPRCIDPEKIIPISRSTTGVFKTGTWGGHFPEYREKLSTCRGACPAGEDIPSYIALARDGDLEGAFYKIAQENPLPSVCGRVCYHPCEQDCLRRDVDEAVPIHRVERFVGDYGLDNLSFPEPIKSAGAAVAVVGSGPAGLSCAYHARRLGCDVTIFEERELLGGMMRLGIPAYRLPRAIVDRSVAMILATGIKTRSGFRLGDAGTWEELDRFDAVFLALGAQGALTPPFPGIELSGVIGGLEFLKQVNMGQRSEVKGSVVVMGGGNTAIDAARVALRLGAETTILYRRSRQEMPASAEEISDALREGAALLERALPVGVESANGDLKITCARTEAGNADESGRLSYAPLEGSEFTLTAGTLIVAVGQSVEVICGGGRPAIGPQPMTVEPFLRIAGQNYFAGGDMAPIPRRLCDAIASGKLAALSMSAMIGGLDMETIWSRVNVGRGGAFSMEEYLSGKESPSPRLKEAVTAAQIKPEWLAGSPRPEPSRLSAREAARGFDEVVGDPSPEELAASCGQCVTCGSCIGCDRCYLFCPEIAVIPPEEPGGAYSGNREYCKGCGVCAAVCPRGVITMGEGT